MKSRWAAMVPVLACIFACVPAVAGNDDNAKLSKSATTSSLMPPVNERVRLRCESYGDLSSLTRAGLRCTASLETQGETNLSASPPLIEVVEEPGTLGEQALAAVEEATSTDGRIVRIVVMPRF